MCCSLDSFVLEHTTARVRWLVPPSAVVYSNTNQASWQCMFGQFVFYHKNEARTCDNQPPGQNVLAAPLIIDQYDVTIASGSCIIDITMTQLFFSFGIVLGANDRQHLRSFRATRRFKLHVSSGTFKWWISSDAELTSVMPSFSSFMNERICGAANHLASDVIIYLPQYRQCTWQ